MVTPFQMAWDLLKTEINPKPHPSDYPALRYMNQMNRLMRGEVLSTDELTHLIEREGQMRQTGLRISPPTPREEEINKVRDFVNNQPQKPNFGIPMQTEQTRLPTLPSSEMLNPLFGNAKLKEMNRRIAENKNKPYRLGSNSHQVDQEVNRNNNIRRFKDQQEAAKLHLQNNPPRLERDEGISADGNLYNIMSGNKDLGNVGIDDTGGIGYGEVKPTYQRQGLYGKTLQAIINERNVLHSTGNRNQNSQPFHEQFNPPNTGKHVTGYLGGNHLPHDNGTDRHTYRALPPEETPENWGALEYDTGALPIYQQKPVEERNAISPRGDSKQYNLEDYWGLDRRFKPQFPFDRQPGQYYPNRED